MLPDRFVCMTAAALLLAAAAAGPARADVKAGVDAWSRGDYAAAVREWEGPAAAGDPDAMFNLGQAYRLGRGVPADLARAEALYASAAAAGHPQAADTYGLMLFQDGRRETALPYVREAARRGDARSQYLLGIAHFNGDLVEKDWVRAYALLTLANGAGLPQAAPALAEMDRHIPLAQRQQAAGLAIDMRTAADAARASELAAFDLAAQAPAPQPPGPPAQATVAQDDPIVPRTPRPDSVVAVSPSVAAARAAVAEAMRATGTESPAAAGASYARLPVLASVDDPAVTPEPSEDAPQAAEAEPASGSWRVQLGAFAVAGNAERLWREIGDRSEFAGRERLLVQSGAVTKLQAAGYPTRAAADTACRSLRRSGQDCLVTDR